MKPVRDLSPRKIFEFICNDFETAWDAVASLPDASCVGRGNFMFALHAMILLEWACRVCAADQPVGSTDTTPVALAEFGKALYALRPDYFLPVVAKPTVEESKWLHGYIERPGVRLPRAPGAMPIDRCPLLWLLWDAIRNGQAHRYQQIVAKQSDAKLCVALSGADYSQTIKATLVHRLAEANHLAPKRSRGALGIQVYPQWLFLDLRDAVNDSNLLERGLPPPTLRDRNYPGFTTRTLDRALLNARVRRMSTR
jgi:hypothetical protein